MVVDGKTPQEILEEAQIITGNESSSYQVSHPEGGRPEDGPTPAQVQMAINEILKADDGSSLPRSSYDDAHGFSTEYSEEFNKRYDHIEHLTSYADAEDLESLYHRE